MTEPWRIPVAVTRVYFVIEADLPIELISERAEIPPSSSRRYRNRLTDLDVTEWRLDLGLGSNSFHTVEHASRRLLELGERVATKVGGIVDEGGTAAFVIAQRVTGNPETTGIALSSAVVAWLATAKALISIDQSVAVDDAWPA